MISIQDIESILDRASDDEIFNATELRAFSELKNVSSNSSGKHLTLALNVRAFGKSTIYVVTVSKAGTGRTDTQCTCKKNTLYCEHTLTALLCLYERLAGEEDTVGHSSQALENVEPKLYTGELYDITNQLYAFFDSRHMHRPALKDFKEDPEQRSCALRFKGAYTARAQYAGKNQLRLSCGCEAFRYQGGCAHLLSLALFIASNRGPHYFKQFDDHSEFILKTFADYGLKPEDPLTKGFKFELNSLGNPALREAPKNLLSLSNLSAFSAAIGASGQSVPAFLKTENMRAHADIESAGLLLYINGKFCHDLWIELLAYNGKSNRKLKFDTFQDLSIMPHLPEKVLGLLNRLSTEHMQAAAEGRIYQHVNIKAKVLGFEREAVQNLVASRQFDVLNTLRQWQVEGLNFYITDDSQSTSGKSCRPARLSAEMVKLNYRLRKEGDFLLLDQLLRLEDNECTLAEVHLLPSAYVLHNDTLFLTDANTRKSLKLFKDGPMMMHISAWEEFMSQVAEPISRGKKLVLDESLQVKDHQPPPVPRVMLSELNESFLLINPTWDYGGHDLTLNSNTGLLRYTDKGFIRILRDEAAEAELMDLLYSLHKDLSAQKGKEFLFISFKEALKNNWFSNFFSTLQDAGVALYGLTELKKFKYNPNQPVLKISSAPGIDWLDLKMELSYGGQKVSLAELRKALLTKQPYILLKDGTLGMLPDEWLRKYTGVMRVARQEGDALKVSKWHYGLLDELEEQISDEEVLRDMEEKKKRLSKEQPYLQPPLPQGLQASLRDYQMRGFHWLVNMDALKWGACLADDMGLGKTLQTLSFLQYKVNAAPGKKHLVVCPTSLIFNWEAEIQKFCPSVKYRVYYGAARSEEDLLSEEFDLLITSYGVARYDIRTLSQMNFGSVILDESQTIKNPQAQISRAVNLLQAENRIILSGTPMQNNTFDLYSQMNFLNRGILGSPEFFKKEYANAIDRDKDAAKSRELKRLISPFILRRSKEQVAPDLPDKTETILWCEMDKGQRKVYETYRDSYRADLLARIEKDGMERSSVYILEALLKLRQICNAPALLKSEKFNAGSVKIQELMRELEENTGEHKILCFSQFTEMLKLIGEHLEEQGISYHYLDGSTPAKKRKELVYSFQEGDGARIFLISLKAGGVGLNLTRADYVYLIDPWWNPAAEQQAIDRTHRIGQTNKIFAYKMICKDSIEEKILHLQQDKRALSRELISEDSGLLKSINLEDLKMLLS